MLSPRLFRPAAALLFAGVLLCAAGCGDSSEPGKVVPVSGRVFLADKPLPGGVVLFTPDESKGNHSKFSASARIQSDGKYTANTANKVGVPPGWYKVTILVNQPGAPTVPVAIDQRYATPEATPLFVEVTENPPEGTYDLKLAK